MYFKICFSLFFCAYFMESLCGPLDTNWKDYNYMEKTNRFYKIHRLNKSWLEAKTVCESEDAILFYPENEEEARIVKVLLPDTSNIMIGVSDIENEGEFKTVDGIPLSDVYHEWRAGQPDDCQIYGGEDCVLFYINNRTSNDIRCDIVRTSPFICKKKFMNNSTHYNDQTGSFYSLHLQPLNWSDAEAACAEQHFHLAVINSQTEAAYFAKLVEDVPTNVLGARKFVNGAIHLGFHNRDGYENKWRTVKGTKLKDSGYALWGSYQPDGQGQEKCGSMFHNGHLNDINCDAECFYICEFEYNEL